MFGELWQYIKWYAELIVDGFVVLAIASIVLFFWWKVLASLWIGHKIFSIMVILASCWIIGRTVND